MRLIAAWYCLAILPFTAAAVRAQVDLAAKEEQAIQAAVAQVAPAVVRIETLGGLETVGSFLFGTGPTTGLMVSADGYIISSAFNFAQKPAQILVYIANSPVPAELVSTDHNRRLVLLKVNTDKPLAVPEIASMKDLRVGQWSIAVGRTFGDGKNPNVSAGIISATNRIWSRAVQTDAKISPANYGGPLVDIRGRVIGVLAPLAQDGFGAPGPASEVAGVEWYDSGIGFAIPLEQITELLPRMKETKELHAGKLGVSLKGTDLFSGDVIIAAAAAGSPAQQAGLKAGDKIIEVDGAKITRQAELRHVLMPRYAGDKIKLAALRGEERIEREIELVAEIAPYQFPFLGILPLREPSEEQGVVVRYVFPDSPAAKADLQPQDRIVALNGKPVADRDGLLELMAAEAVDHEVELEIRRGEATKKQKVKLAAYPELIPGELPPAHGEIPPGDGEKRATGLVSIKIPEIANSCSAYVPESYQANVPHGVVVWLHGPGGYQEAELAEAWKEHCGKHDLILLAPKSGDPLKWQRDELEFIRKTLDDVLAKYNVDRKRITVAGVEGGGAMAYLFAFGNRELVPGVVAIEAPLPAGTRVPATDAVQRQVFYVASAKQSSSAAQIQATIQQLRGLKYPVTVKDLGDTSRPLAAEERAELARWTDTLDRI
ncbi:MAG: PDZ domain-containing protein [Pirellulales bacterium]